MKRSFEFMQLDPNLLSTFDSLTLKKVENRTEEGKTKTEYVIEDCTLTYAQSLILERVSKRNTVFCDQLTQMLHLDYDLHDTQLDFQYEAIFVDLNALRKKIYVSHMTGETDPETGEPIHELVSVSNKDLKKWLFLNGFSISGVPARKKTEMLSADGTVTEKWSPRPTGKVVDGPVETIRYRAFVASASMARKGQVLFVNEQHYKALIERLTLDFFTFDEENKQLRMPHRNSEGACRKDEWFHSGFWVQTAKFSSYLGLMLSDGSSLEELQKVWEKTHSQPFALPRLDHETVFLAHDMQVDAKPYYEGLGDFAWVIEGTPIAEGDTSDQRVFTAKLKKTAELSMQLNMFDGVGLCSPDYFEKIENLLLCRRPGEANDHPINAIVIRLPWIKGVLVKADFQGFFRERAERAGFDLKDRKLKDFFGIERDLHKIEIILNDSMMKGWKYLKNLHRYIDPAEAGAKQPDPKLSDPWKHYWKKIDAYGISMLIAGKNSAERTAERINYQFLSTSGLSDETIQKLCDATADRILQDLHSCRTDRPEDADNDTGDNDLQQQDIPLQATLDDPDGQGEDGAPPYAAAQTGKDDLPNADDAVVIATFDAFMEALDPESQAQLRNTSYVRESAQAFARSRLLDGMKGRLDVKGDYRFVMPDLLSYLHYIFDRYIHRQDKPALYSALNTADRRCSGHGCYYAPGEKTPWQSTDKEGIIHAQEIACLRNPHYALGETAIVRPVDKDRRAEYDRWFGHLFSVVMLPATAVQTIGGADFDGDKCLCLADRDVIADITAHIEKNKAILHYMAAHRASFDAMLAQCSLPVAAKLQAWLHNTDFVPEIGKGFHFRWAACPPLIFGADGDAKTFNCTEAYIEPKIYNAFDLTTQQRIGELSLLALQYSSKAYQVNRRGPECTDADAWTDEQYQNLESWLWHWRMVSLALENGAEIDMAKTGIRCLSAELRVNKPIEKPKADAAYPQLAALFTFDTKANLLGTFRKIEAAPDRRGQPLRRVRGRAFADTLLDRLLRDNEQKADLLEISRELLAKGHNNTELLPWRIYTALLDKVRALPAESIDDLENNDLLLRLDTQSGTGLRTFLRRRLGISNKHKASDAADTTDRTAAEPTGRKANPIRMAQLVWAKDDIRQTEVENYLRHYLDDTGREAMPSFTDAAVIRDEQGIYFLKETAKFLFHAGLSEISNADGADTPMTPAALRDALEVLLPDAMDRLTYLLQYHGRIYDRVENETRDILDDHLLVALIGRDFHLLIDPPAASAKNRPDEEICRRIDAKMKAYAEARLVRRGHAEARRKLSERYYYSMRNLQRRFSLAGAIRMMRPYSGAYAETPLGVFGIPSDRLSRVFADLEETKTEGEV